MNASWASENFEAFIIIRSSQPRGHYTLTKNGQVFRPGQLEALDRRMDQLFGHHAALSKWLRSTNACARHAFDSELAREVDDEPVYGDLLGGSAGARTG